MTKNQDPYALPGAAGQRLKAQRQRTQRRRPDGGGEFTFATRRFLVWALGGGAVVGLVAFSLAWPSGMPFALYVGLAVAVAWAVLATGVRWLQARAAAQR